MSQRTPVHQLGRRSNRVLGNLLPLRHPVRLMVPGSCFQTNTVLFGKGYDCVLTGSPNYILMFFQFSA